MTLDVHSCIWELPEAKKMGDTSPYSPPLCAFEQTAQVWISFL
jgi:hypothetical protein